jgi:DUF971 family protein
MTHPYLPHNNDRAVLHWTEDGALGIDWSDGHKSNYGLDFLRQNCPCALCRNLKQNPLALHKMPPGKPTVLKALEVQPVGRYAIQITWNDGHKTGIYSYEHLRELSKSGTE